MQGSKMARNINHTQDSPKTQKELVKIDARGLN